MPRRPLRLRALAEAAGRLGGGRLAPRPAVVPGVVREVERYGDGPRQYGEWWVPAGPADGLLPTVVLLHGGYWRRRYDLSLQDAVAAELAGRGVLCWNLEYAGADAGWPATLRDVAAGHDHLRVSRYADRVDPDRVAAVGHSAGGHLALWLASRHRAVQRSDGAVGAPVGDVPAGPSPSLVVAQAPLACLARAAAQALGGGAVLDLVGGTPEQVPDRYAVADPEALVPTGCRSVLLHAAGDDVVPLAQSRSYVAAAGAAGDDVRLEVVPGGHFEHLDPRSQAGAALLRALAAL